MIKPTQWYLLAFPGAQEAGPYTYADLAALRAAGRLKEGAAVRRKGAERWECAFFMMDRAVPGVGRMLVIVAGVMLLGVLVLKGRSIYAASPAPAPPAPLEEKPRNSSKVARKANEIADTSALKKEAVERDFDRDIQEAKKLLKKWEDLYDVKGKKWRMRALPEGAELEALKTEIAGAEESLEKREKELTELREAKYRRIQEITDEAVAAMKDAERQGE